jgi:hypothetical protein
VVVGYWRRSRTTYLSISPPILVGIQCPHCQSLLGMFEDCSGPAWPFLDTVKYHLGKILLSYAVAEGPPLLHLRNSTYVNNHHLKSAKSSISDS